MKQTLYIIVGFSISLLLVFQVGLLLALVKPDVYSLLNHADSTAAVIDPSHLVDSTITFLDSAALAPESPEQQMTHLKDSLETLAAMYRQEQEKASGYESKIKAAEAVSAPPVVEPKKLDPKELKEKAKLLEVMTPEDAANVLKRLTQEESKEILKAMKKKQAGKILANLTPDQIAGIMR